MHVDVKHLVSVCVPPCCRECVCVFSQARQREQGYAAYKTLCLTLAMLGLQMKSFGVNYCLQDRCSAGACAHLAGSWKV